MFRGLVNLRQLILAKNNISFIDAGSFLPLINLIELDLSGNKLTMINRDMFKGLNKLETLDLSQNKISQIRPNSFDDLVKLKKLNLSQNELTALDQQDLFEQLHELKDVNLYGNILKNECVNNPLKRNGNSQSNISKKRKH